MLRMQPNSEFAFLTLGNKNRIALFLLSWWQTFQKRCAAGAHGHQIAQVIDISLKNFLSTIDSPEQDHTDIWVLYSHVCKIFMMFQKESVSFVILSTNTL